MPKLETQASTSLHCLTGQGILDWVAMGNLLMMVPPSEVALGSRTRSRTDQSYLPFDPKATRFSVTGSPPASLSWRSGLSYESVSKIRQLSQVTNASSVRI
jgi:hypothetical protein